MIPCDVCLRCGSDDMRTEFMDFVCNQCGASAVDESLNRVEAEACDRSAVIVDERPCPF